MKIEKYKEVASQDNQYIKLARSLVFKKNRLDEGLYLADGLRVVMEALNHGDVRVCFISRSRLKEIEQNKELAELINRKKGNEIIVISDSLFAKIAPTDSPQGIAALCSLPKYQYDDNEIPGLTPEGCFLPLLEGISDPGNCGTIIRLAVGMGIREIAMTGNMADPYGPKAVRASSGLIAKARIYYHQDIGVMIKRLKELNFKILATDSRAEKSVRGYIFPLKTALVLGGEAQGISDDTAFLADETLNIPVIDDVDSYNVATSAAIFFYEYISGKQNINHKHSSET